MSDAPVAQAETVGVQGFFRKNATIGLAEIAGRIPLIFIAGYVARKLGPATYGNWALVITYAVVVASVVTFGLPIAISRLGSVARAGTAKAYLRMGLRWSVIGFAAVTVVTLVARPWIAEALGMSKDRSWLLPLGCLIIAISGIEGLLQAYFPARELVARQSLFVLLRSVIEVVSILFGFSGAVHISGLSTTTSNLLVYLLTSLFLKSLVYSALVLFRAPKQEGLDPPERRTFLRYGLPMIPAALVALLMVQGDRLALGHLFDKDQLGIYAFAASLAAYVAVLGYIVNPLLLPRASKLHDAGDHANVGRLFRRSQQVYFGLYALVVSILVLFSHEIVDITAGQKYAASGLVLIILAASVGLDGLLGIFQWVFQLAKRPAYVLWFNVGYMLLNIVGVLIGAWIGGPVAVAIGILVTTVIANTVRYGISRHLLPVPIEPRVVAGLLALTLFSLFGWYVARDWAFGLRLLLEAGLIMLAGAILAHLLHRRGFRLVGGKLMPGVPIS
jgi:O-antigen/teichoic acid export membrane protein